MSERKVHITILDLDKFSRVDKCTYCEECLYGTMDRNMTNCPIIKRIANDVTQTSYCIDGAKLYINAATYNHDFRRAVSVVTQAIDNRCRTGR